MKNKTLAQIQKAKATTKALLLGIGIGFWGMVMGQSAGIDDSTVYLLQADTEGPVVDTSLEPKIVMGIGNPQVDTENTKVGTGAIAFDGDQDYLETADHPDFYFGGEDFTIEFWIKAQAPDKENIFSQWDATDILGSSFLFEIDEKGVLTASLATSEIIESLQVHQDIRHNYHHIALVRNQTDLTLYLDGASVGSKTLTGFSVNDGQMAVLLGGSIGGENADFTGYIDELRVSSIARWTENFTPADQPYAAYVPLPPTASDMIVDGVLVEGATITAQYTYTDPEGDEEGETQFQWYVGETIEGSFDPIEGSQNSELILDENFIGKYLKLGITPVAIEEPVEGEEIFSDSVGPIQGDTDADQVPDASDTCDNSLSPEGLSGYWGFNTEELFDSMGGLKAQKEETAQVQEGFIGSVLQINPGAQGAKTETGFEIGTTDFSVGIWLQTTQNQDSTPYLFTNRDTATTNQFALRLTVSEYPEFAIHAGEEMKVTGSTSINDGEWHYLVGTRNQEKVALYLDGELVEEKEVPAQDITTTEHLVFGGLGNGDENYTFSGQLDEATFFQRAISQAEVRSYFTDGLQRKSLCHSRLAPFIQDLTLTGEPTVGSLLTLTYTFQDPEEDEEGESIIEWWIGEEGSEERTLVPDANGTSFKLEPEHEGKIVTASVTPVSTVYPFEGESLQSLPTSIITQPYELYTWPQSSTQEGRITIYGVMKKEGLNYTPEQMLFQLVKAQTQEVLQNHTLTTVGIDQCEEEETNQENCQIQGNGKIIPGIFLSAYNEDISQARFMSEFPAVAQDQEVQIRTTAYQAGKAIFTTISKTFMAEVPQRPQMVIDPTSVVTNEGTQVITGTIIEKNFESGNLTVNQIPVSNLYRVNNQNSTWTFDHTLNLSEGENVLQFQVTDSGGNSTEETLNITLDKTPPTNPVIEEITLLENEASQAQGSIQIQWKKGEEAQGKESFQVWRKAEALSTVGALVQGENHDFVPVSPLLEEGTTSWIDTARFPNTKYTYYIEATDFVGNQVHSREKDIISQSFRPGITILTPQNKALLSDSYFEVTAHYAAATPTKCEVQIDSEAWLEMNNDGEIEGMVDYSFTNIKEGEHNLAVRCIDQEGNSAYAPLHTIILDHQKPVAHVRALRLRDKDNNPLFRLRTHLRDNRKGKLKCRVRKNNQEENYEPCRNFYDVVSDQTDTTDIQVELEVEEGAQNQNLVTQTLTKAQQIPPSATNILLSGSLIEGETLTAEYLYTDPTGESEGETVIEWFSMVSTEGEDTVLQEESSMQYVLTSEDVGKYFRVHITPVRVGTQEVSGSLKKSAIVGPILGLSDLGVSEEGVITLGSENEGEVIPPEGKNNIKWEEGEVISFESGAIEKSVSTARINSQPFLTVYANEVGQEYEDHNVMQFEIISEDETLNFYHNKYAFRLPARARIMTSSNWDRNLLHPKEITPEEGSDIDYQVKYASDWWLSEKPITLRLPRRKAHPHMYRNNQWQKITDRCSPTAQPDFPKSCFYTTKKALYIRTHWLSQVALIKDVTRPQISDAVLSEDNQSIEVSFSEGIYGEEGGLTLFDLELDITSPDSEENNPESIFIKSLTKLNGQPLEGGEEVVLVKLAAPKRVKQKTLVSIRPVFRAIKDLAENRMDHETPPSQLELHKFKILTQPIIDGLSLEGKELQAQLDVAPETSETIVWKWLYSSDGKNYFASIPRAAENRYQLDTPDVGQYLKAQAVLVDENQEPVSLPVESEVLGPVGADSDRDEIEESIDNCPLRANPEQEDTDQDQIGNECDECPTLASPTEEDLSGTLCDFAPEANSVIINGSPYVGKELRGDYVFVDQDEEAEGATEYRWRVSDQAEGPFVPLENAIEKTYLLTDQEVGKYIQFEVVPVSISDRFSEGESVMSSVFGPVNGLESTRNFTAFPSGTEIELSSAEAGAAQISVGVSLVVLSPGQKLSVDQGTELVDSISAKVGEVSIQEALQQHKDESFAKTNVKKVTLQSGISGEEIVIASTDNLEVAIPDGTEIFADDTWDGTIMPPEDVTDTLDIPWFDEKVMMVLGAAGESLLLSNPVKIVLPTSEGTPVYSPNGIDGWVEIENQCTDVEGGGLVFPHECYIKSGNTTIIWTYHFSGYGSVGQSGQLLVDFGDDNGDTITNPSVTMSGTISSFQNQTSTGTLGTSTEQIIVANRTDTQAWSVTIAATDGNTAVWEDTTPSSSYTMDFNDTSGAGQLTIDPSSATPYVATLDGSRKITGLTADPSGVSVGSQASFEQGVTDSITLFSSTTATAQSVYTLQGVDMSQVVPAKKEGGSYEINLTLTVS